MLHLLLAASPGNREDRCISGSQFHPNQMPMGECKVDGV